MTKQEILAHCDHTLLKASASWVQIRELCEEAVRFHTASVCVPACYLKRIRAEFPSLNLCTVVGFPLGYSSTEGKLAETEKALEDGANEIDMVINLTDVKNRDYEAVTKEIATLKAVCGENILKVIVETCELTEEEKVRVCDCVTKGGADFIKTSTGFGSAGATLEDISLFRKHIGSKVLIKAAGGIRTVDALQAFLDAGCDRIGTSAAVRLLKDEL